ncbi:MAG: alpha/beta fold hydrolase [Candidatus Falkowbacteria bacterium]
MITKLLEFNNQSEALLRGILATEQEFRKDYAVVMLGGFERAGTTDPKFKSLADRLAEAGIASFRFDVSGCGLSDGDFYHQTTESLSAELQNAVELLKGQGYQKFVLVGHSQAGCAIALAWIKIRPAKIVLIAPALNQQDLLRLWFAQKNNKEIKIGWANYKNYFQEEEFLANVQQDMVAKSHKLNYLYRFENKDRDYSQNLADFPTDNLLCIHGDNDQVVPLESLKLDFKNKIIVAQGDHDLVKPGAIEQWIDKAVDFIEL